MPTIIYDIETDGLAPTLVHCVSVHVIETGKAYTFAASPEADYPLSEFKQYLIGMAQQGSLTLACHNQYGYDLWALRSLLDIDLHYDTLHGIPIRTTDTLVLSRMFNPKRWGGHGLAGWGEKMGISKPEVEEWIDLPIEVYIHRCKEDVKINTAVYHALLKEAAPFSPSAIRLFLKTQWLMECQARTGTPFNRDVALSIYEEYETQTGTLYELINSVLPIVPNTVKKNHVYLPKRRFKTDKQEVILSAKMDELNTSLSLGITKVDGEWIYNGHPLKDYAIEEKILLNPYHAGNVDNTNDLVAHLLQYGWQPTIHTASEAPKLYDKGVICPDLLTVDLSTAGISKETIGRISEYYSKKNRASRIYNPDKETGLVTVPRLNIDSRLSARSTGFAETLRQKHKEVSNLWEEIKVAVKAPAGYIFCGYDASALENRVAAHGAYEFDKGEMVQRMMQEGYDDYVYTAQAMGVYDEENHKASRALGKTVTLGVGFGMGATKLARSLECKVATAKGYIEAYWSARKGLKKLGNKLKIKWESTQGKYIDIKETGCRIYEKNEHGLINRYTQHIGTVLMNASACYLDVWLGGIQLDKAQPYYIYKGYKIQRCVYYHDEYLWLIPNTMEENIRKELTQLFQQSMIKAGELYNMTIPITSDCKWGYTWEEVH